MPKFNRLFKRSTVTNLAGGQAFAQSPELELTSMLLSSLMQDQFYRKANDQVERLGAVIDALPDKQFAGQAAVYARETFGMRSITHVAAAHIARTVKGATWTRPMFTRLVQRPDDATEIVALYQAQNGKGKLPNSLKDGIAGALSGFDAYQLAKYRQGGRTVSLVDVVNLTHPKANQQLSALIRGTLEAAQTWETKLSAAGQDAEDADAAKAAAWQELVATRKIGQLALLRNLRNILEQAPELVPATCELLTDELRVQRARIFPFQYDNAYRQLEDRGDRTILDALSQAMEVSLGNVPRLPGKTCVVLDCSGSMQGKPAQIGSLFAAVLYKTNDADLVLFSDNARYQALNARDSVMTLAGSIRFASGGTNFHAPFETMKRAYDRIIILSDMQGWTGHYSPATTFAKYREKYACDPHVYSYDLQGYGTLQFPERRVYALAGFSDRVFDVMGRLEEDREALVNTIKAIQLETEPA